MQRAISGSGALLTGLISTGIGEVTQPSLIPGILRQYADSFDIDTSNYSFLTGPKAVIEALMDQMGILVDGDTDTDTDTDLIRHTLGTVLIDESGVIRHRAFGSNWLVSDFLERLQEL